MRAPPSSMHGLRDRKEAAAGGATLGGGAPAERGGSRLLRQPFIFLADSLGSSSQGAATAPGTMTTSSTGGISEEEEPLRCSTPELLWAVLRWGLLILAALLPRLLLLLADLGAARTLLDVAVTPCIDCEWRALASAGNCCRGAGDSWAASAHSSAASGCAAPCPAPGRAARHSELPCSMNLPKNATHLTLCHVGTTGRAIAAEHSMAAPGCRCACCGRQEPPLPVLAVVSAAPLTTFDIAANSENLRCNRPLNQNAASWRAAIAQPRKPPPALRWWKC